VPGVNCAIADIVAADLVRRRAPLPADTLIRIVRRENEA
jgi:hypothetical protein